MVLFLVLLQVRLESTPEEQVTIVTSLEASNIINWRSKSSK